MIHDAEEFRGRHLLAYSLNVHLRPRFERQLEHWCGIIPERLHQLETATFDRLHHGIQRLGIVCHDATTGRPRYFGTGFDRGVPLAAAVRASASIPHLFPPVAVSCNHERLELTDGGVTDPLPLDFARGIEIGATHVVVSDCRWIGRVPATDSSTVWIRPRMLRTGTLWAPARGLASAVQDGESAVSSFVLRRIAAWRSAGDMVAAAG